MGRIVVLCCIVICSASVAFAEGNPIIRFDSFVSVSKETESYRRGRLISEATFIEMAQDANTIILDTRSKQKYDEKHIAGAVHINFSDFTKETLAKKIAGKDTRILIYCNNNFKNDQRSFQSKMAPLALNIPTFINLYGYGYKNVYELQPLLDIKTTKIAFEGSLVK